MTAAELLGWIALGIAVQVVAALGVGFARHWGRYRALRSQVDDHPAAEADRAQASSAPAWPGRRRFRIAAKRPACPDGSVCSFELAPADGKPLPAFLPGQYLTFQLEPPGVEGGRETLVRCYSLSDAPKPDSYRISVKRVPGGRSSNLFHDTLAVGSELLVGAPAGHFHLDGGDGPAVLIAGGIGITPMFSMAASSLAAQPGRELWLFYGVRNGREHALKAELEALAAAHANFHLRVCYSSPLAEDAAGRDYHHHGRVSSELLRLQLPLKPYHFHICGPTAMMADLVGGLDDWGVPGHRIHFEAFGPASIKRRQPAPAAEVATAGGLTVTFAKSGKRVAWPAGAGSLLEVAEREGIAMASACRAGACGTCQTTIRSGEVRYVQTPDFDPQPGNCLPCTCVPRTDLTLEV